MQYIADSNGYLKEVSFGCLISCDGAICVEYTGAVPSGYSTLAEWYAGECDNLHQWHISGGNLTKDSSATVEALNNVDCVVDHGKTGVWTWRKWASGIAETWGIFEATSLAVNNAWGSVYYGTWMNTTANKNGREYPFAFTDTPSVIASPYSPSTDFWLLTDSTNNLGTVKTHAPAYACVLPGSTTITNPQIHYYVIGRWK